jgi:hypothetical protein
VATALLLVGLVSTTAPAEAYVVEGHRWHHDDLTWSLRGQPNGVTTQQAATAIQAALDSWAAVTPLSFTQIDDCGGCPNEPDLRVWFTTNPHGGGVDPAFGQGYGHALYPPTTDGPGLAGDIHLDNSFRWYVDGTHVPDVRSIVTHESGHALGLKHATACPNQESPTRPIMCPLILGVQRTLGPDDVQGMQSIYGRPDHLVDSTVRRWSDRTAVGNDVVNTNAVGQRVTTSRARGGQATFVVRVTNDGASDDVVALRAPAPPTGFGIRYYAGTTGSTPATGITQGTYEVSLHPGQFAAIRIVVTVKSNAVRHRSRGFSIRATSERDDSRVDVVLPIVAVT